MRYSFVNLLRGAATDHRDWPPAWRTAKLKSAYDVIIIGGGGHGLATAYYLAKNHGITNVAVLEKGWLGGGNTGRNTTVVRSNYLHDESAPLYEHALKMWPHLSHELNYNVMFSQRGVVALAFTQHELDQMHRRVQALNLNGIDSEMLSLKQLKKWVPILRLQADARYPVIGGMVQRRGGTARHDAVAWGFARAASALGVDIVQNCAVTGIKIQGNRVISVETSSHGCAATGRIGVAVAGHTSEVMRMAGIRMPIQSFPLQALVSEPIKPVLHTVVMSGMVPIYVSQSDKGELVMGASRDGYISYAQRGSFHLIEEQLKALVELFPIFSRLRMLRQWAGIVDVTPDASPIIGKTPVDGCFVNCGWGTGGFKATPGAGWLFAHTIANDRPHALNAPFGLNRFAEGRLIDEGAAAGVGH